ncbi:MAG: hypothetical protein HQK78_08255 [Desulfobacterales bacterium]|nr:hypothetical protein [Desulfobacterales bacterium]
MERLETTDIFLSAFFLSMGSELLEIKVAGGPKAIASFLIAGKDLAKLDKSYASGNASVNPVQLRASLNWLKDVLFEKLKKNKGRYESDITRKNRCRKERY